MQSAKLEQLSSADAQVILDRMAERLRLSYIARAAEIEYPIEAIDSTAKHYPARSNRSAASGMLGNDPAGGRRE